MSRRVNKAENNNTQAEHEKIENIFENRISKDDISSFTEIEGSTDTSRAKKAERTFDKMNAARARNSQ